MRVIKQVAKKTFSLVGQFGLEVEALRVSAVSNASEKAEKMEDVSKDGEGSVNYLSW